MKINGFFFYLKVSSDPCRSLIQIFFIEKRKENVKELTNGLGDFDWNHPV